MRFKEIIGLILMLAVIWAAITLVWWSFGVKSDSVETCEKNCYTTIPHTYKVLSPGNASEYHEYTADYYISISCLSDGDPRVKNETFCQTHLSERKITLVEVLQDQAKAPWDYLAAAASWGSSYKVGVWGV